MTCRIYDWPGLTQPVPTWLKTALLSIAHTAWAWPGLHALPLQGWQPYMARSPQEVWRPGRLNYSSANVFHAFRNNETHVHFFLNNLSSMVLCFCVETRSSFASYFCSWVEKVQRCGRVLWKVLIDQLVIPVNLLKAQTGGTFDSPLICEMNRKGCILTSSIHL